MAEYALLMAGNAWAPVHAGAVRLASSIGPLEIFLVVGGIWVVYKLMDVVTGRG